jgi:pseudouridylate synthase
MPWLVAPEVEDALRRGRAVVALESTVICHGLPRPGNLAAARALEAAVREEGAVPATIALLDGAVRIGLGPADLERLARAKQVAKCSTRDLALVLAEGGMGATTVAATIALAARAGIGVMATGGIGGVHRGGEASLDVSADLHELARSPVVVVASGAKVILDLPRTLEVLETLGVPVVGFATDRFPAFYCRDVGLTLPAVADLERLARMVTAQRALGRPGGILVANPPPAEHALPRAALEEWIAVARAEALAAGIAGPAETPFLLQALARHSGGRTVKVNEALLQANARLAARLACRLAAAGEIA